MEKLTDQVATSFATAATAALAKRRREALREYAEVLGGAEPGDAERAVALCRELSITPDQFSRHVAVRAEHRVALSRIADAAAMERLQAAARDAGAALARAREALQHAEHAAGSASFALKQQIKTNAEQERRVNLLRDECPQAFGDERPRASFAM
jgi:hypothetical protein